MKRDDYIKAHWQNYQSREGGSDRDRTACERMAGDAWDRGAPERTVHQEWLRGKIVGAEEAAARVRRLAGDAFAAGHDEKAHLARSIAIDLDALVDALRRASREHAEANDIEVMPIDGGAGS